MKWEKSESIESTTSPKRVIKEIKDDLLDFLNSDDEIRNISITGDVCKYLSELYKDTLLYECNSREIADKYVSSLRYVIAKNDMDIKVKKRGLNVYIIKITVHKIVVD